MNRKDKRPLPDFLGIGAQRTGSTWLYKHLSAHPEIWMPPIKEIHYFDIHIRNNPTRTQEKFRQDFEKRLEAYRPNWSKKKSKDEKNFSWDINYFRRTPSLDWYRSIFSQGEKKVTGEITPSYMALEHQIVEQIYSYNPEMKILFFMRDPIDRVWSAAVKHLAKIRKRKAIKVTNEEFENFIHENGTVLRTSYLRSLKNWEDVFPSNQIYIDFFDNIQENPEAVLLQVFSFLGVEEVTDFYTHDLTKKIGTTQRFTMQIPDELETMIAEKYIDQLELLNQRFGGHTEKWLARAKKALE